MQVIKVLIGIGLIIVGVLNGYKLTIEIKKGDKGGYGVHANGYFAYFSMIIIGIYLLLK